MKATLISVKSLLFLLIVGASLSMTAVATLAYVLTRKVETLLCGMLLTIVAIAWLLILTSVFGRRLTQFTTTLGQTLDDMINSKEVNLPADSDTLLGRIDHRLSRLYSILQAKERKVNEERQELQKLVSDISHQLKTPISNLTMLMDTLLTKPVTNTEPMKFLDGIRKQTDILGFLIDALVKTSRLETGSIRLVKQDALLYVTLAQAMSGIVYGAEQKNISVSVNCPENLRLSHDSKWTAEALFNILDNAVKYTPISGQIAVTAEQWEMSVRIQVTDTGKGIPVDHYAAIFQRFYREENVHNVLGVGIGLYLAREIISRQSGFITVSSKVGQGSAFMVMLPRM